MKKLIILVFAALFLSPVFGQSNEIMDEIIEQKKIDFDYAVYLVLSASDLIDESIEPYDAVLKLNEQNWNIKEVRSDGKITLGEASVLIMESLDLPGGIMYSILPVERYAYKELVFNGLLKPEENLKRNISGLELLNILSGALKLKEGEVE